MAADDPKSVAEQFKHVIATPPAFVIRSPAEPSSAVDVNALAAAVPEVVQQVVKFHPIVHSMINFVVANFVANVAISAYVFHPPFSHMNGKGSPTNLFVVAYHP
jgi:thiamine-phosphate diphosphorylase/hydroxyethylthiazole kinase